VDKGSKLECKRLKEASAREQRSAVSDQGSEKQGSDGGQRIEKQGFSLQQSAQESPVRADVVFPHPER
jgi:hypothetical protein